MVSNVVTTDMESPYPVLLLPKKCTNLEINCDDTDNVFIDVEIVTTDKDGNSICIYSGFCNIKLIDSYDDVSIQFTKTPETSMSSVTDSESPEIISDDSLPVGLADEQSLYNQSQVWINPARSPYVYNHGRPKSHESYSVCHRTGTSITVEQHNTYVGQRVIFSYSTHEELQKKPRLQAPEQQNRLFLNKQPEEIINENQKQAMQERKFMGIHSDNSALKQLMSPGIQSSSKQQKTIIYLGPDSESGQTIQRIRYYDPMIGCFGEPGVDKEVISGFQSEAQGGAPQPSTSQQPPKHPKINKITSPGFQSEAQGGAPQPSTSQQPQKHPLQWNKLFKK